MCYSIETGEAVVSNFGRHRTCVAFDTLRIVIDSDGIAFHTRFNVKKIHNIPIANKMLEAFKRVKTLNHNYYFINNSCTQQ